MYADGAWLLVGTGRGTTTFGIKTGFSTTQGDKTTADVQGSLAAAAKAGTTFKGADVGPSISESIGRDIEDASTEEYGVTSDYTRPGRKDDDLVEIWYWVVGHKDD